MAGELRHFIGGRHFAGASGRFAEVFMPMTGETAARVPLANRAELDTAVTSARAAQPAGPRSIRSVAAAC